MSVFQVFIHFKYEDPVNKNHITIKSLMGTIKPNMLAVKSARDIIKAIASNMRCATRFLDESQRVVLKLTPLGIRLVEMYIDTLPGFIGTMGNCQLYLQGDLYSNGFINLTKVRLISKATPITATVSI